MDVPNPSSYHRTMKTAQVPYAHGSHPTLPGHPISPYTQPLICPFISSLYHQSASDEQDAPKTPDASSARKSSPCRPTPRLPSPSSSAMPWGIPVPLSTSPPGLLHHTPPYSTLNDTLASEDVGGSTVIPNATARVQLSPVSTEPSPTAREASVAAAAAATTATARGGGTGESRRRPGERPRRQVAQPVSYQEPLLNVKMRK